ncbi:MAG: hypothetical protein ABI480_02830 [Chitinophagaceae bacterium]
MAKINDVIITGKLKNLVFYERLGTLCVRTIPVNVRQTKGTKKNAKTFGQAAKIMKYLREGLLPVISPVKDTYTANRFNIAIHQWLKSADRNIGLSSINSFQFNEKANLADRLGFIPATDWTDPAIVRIHIPAIIPTKQIKAPKNTTHIHWTVIITGSKVEQPCLTSNLSILIDTVWNDELVPARTIEFPYRLNPDSINVVAMLMQYSVKCKMTTQRMDDKQWMASGIIAAKFKE